MGPHGFTRAHLDPYWVQYEPIRVRSKNIPIWGYKWRIERIVSAFVFDLLGSHFQCVCHRVLLCFEVFPEKVTLGDAEFSRNLKRRLGRCSTGKSFRVVYGRIGFLENLKFQAVVKGIFEMLETKTIQFRRSCQVLSNSKAVKQIRSFLSF